MINWDEIDELADRARSNDAALAELLRQLVPWIIGFFNKSGVAHDDAGDLAQDVAIKIIRNRHNYNREKGLYKFWLRRISRNLLIDHWKKKQERQFPDKAPDVEDCPDQDFLEQEERKRELEDCVERLPDNQRLIVTLHHFKGMPLKEIAADILRRKEGTVRAWHSEAKANLRKCLEN